MIAKRLEALHQTPPLEVERRRDHPIPIMTPQENGHGHKNGHRDRKNQVGDKTFRDKAPLLLKCLLREGIRSVGQRTPELAHELAVSKDTISRIAQRLATETNLVQIVPNSGSGGRGTLIRITGRRYIEAEGWIKDMTQRGQMGGATL